MNIWRGALIWVGNLLLVLSLLLVAVHVCVGSQLAGGLDLLIAMMGLAAWAAQSPKDTSPELRGAVGIGLVLQIRFSSLTLAAFVGGCSTA